MPENAGVIVRTAAEGATEEELARDVERLAAQWEDIERKAKTASAPELLYGEPDLTIRVVRDIFNEDFSQAGRRRRRRVGRSWTSTSATWRPTSPTGWSAGRDDQDVFAAYRIDEQIAKALERKVWLPSGGSLVIDRTEAMTVVDVNTGKFTGPGGNLEETVTQNNLEAAEEIVRQLRLRDIGGIIVIDFIDMVLESNRDLVLRAAARVPGPRPHQAPGRRGHLARPGADDPQAGRLRAARGVLASRASTATGAACIVSLEPGRSSRQPRAAGPLGGGGQPTSGPGQQRRPAAATRPGRAGDGTAGNGQTAGRGTGSGGANGQRPADERPRQRRRKGRGENTAALRPGRRPPAGEDGGRRRADGVGTAPADAAGRPAGVGPTPAARTVASGAGRPAAGRA